MKQLTHFTMPVAIGYDLDNVRRVEFLFKQYQTSEAPALKSCVWESDGSGDGVREEGRDVIDLTWTPEETALFQPDEWFYMDTRLSLVKSLDNPETSVVALKMTPTLFKE